MVRRGIRLTLFCFRVTDCSCNDLPVLLKLKVSESD